jgi:hypothetical protein
MQPNGNDLIHVPERVNGIHEQITKQCAARRDDLNWLVSAASIASVGKNFKIRAVTVVELYWGCDKSVSTRVDLLSV